MVVVALGHDVVQRVAARDVQLEGQRPGFEPAPERPIALHTDEVAVFETNLVHGPAGRVRVGVIPSLRFPSLDCNSPLIGSTSSRKNIPGPLL